LKRAVLLDALGTLVELQPPAPRLRARLAEVGFEVSEEQAAADTLFTVTNDLMVCKVVTRGCSFIYVC
jgi:hypothetical protein